MNSSINSVHPIEILLVEDNPGDVRLTVEVFKEAKIHNNLHVAVDGIEAMTFQHREGKYSKASRPDLILLDLNLPKKDGREVLAEIKNDPLLKSIPGGGGDDLEGRRGHLKVLCPACELLHHQAYRGFLAHYSQVAEELIFRLYDRSFEVWKSLAFPGYCVSNLF